MIVYPNVPLSCSIGGKRIGRSLPIRAYRSDRLVISAGDESEVVPLDELERRYITRVLAIVGQNKTRAAAVLGLDRRTLYRRLERYSTDGAPISASRRAPSGSNSASRAER